MNEFCAIIDEDCEKAEAFDNLTHGMGRNLLKSSLALVEECIGKAEWYLKFPHNALMRNCMCGQRKMENIDGELGLITCIQYKNDDTHNIPVQVEKSENTIRSSPNWQPYIVDVNKKE